MLGVIHSFATHRARLGDPHLGDGFKYNYLNVVKTIFFMNLDTAGPLFVFRILSLNPTGRLVPYATGEP